MLAIVEKFSGSPRNPYGAHCSYEFKDGIEGYKRAWRLHFSQINGGKLTGTATGPIRGTVRRCEMIAAAMKPPCSLPSTESISARDGEKSPLTGDFPETPGDYGLSRWKETSEAKDPEKAKVFTCSDLAIIKRAALAEVKRRAEDREKEEAKTKETTEEDIAGLDEMEALEAIAASLIEKPRPNEHSCDLKPAEGYDRMRRVNGKHEHEGKPYDVLYGFKGDSSEEVAYYYPVEDWSEPAAHTHCKDHDGTFHAATQSTEKGDEGVVHSISVLKVDKARQEVYGIALKANVPDAYGDAISDEDVENAIHTFVAELSRGDLEWSLQKPDGTRISGKRRAGVDHKSWSKEIEFIELAVMRPGDTWCGRNFMQTTGVVAVHVKDPETWERVEKGELAGFSIVGTVHPEPVS